MQQPLQKPHSQMKCLKQQQQQETGEGGMPSQLMQQHLQKGLNQMDPLCHQAILALKGPKQMTGSPWPVSAGAQTATKQPKQAQVRAEEPPDVPDAARLLHWTQYQQTRPMQDML